MPYAATIIDESAHGRTVRQIVSRVKSFNIEAIVAQVNKGNTGGEARIRSE
jgi:hypothetical protein